MIFNTSSIVAYAVGLVLIFILCRIFIKPIKWVLKLLFNSILGGLILTALNFAGGFLGVSVSITPLTALLSGCLGIPGVFLVVILQYVL